VADDDDGFRAVLRGLLDGLAGRVLEAPDGGQALALAKDHPVDLVLADMRMPGLDGGALLARLPAEVPAIVITSADLRPPARAAALLRKDELTAERLEFTIRAVIGGRRDRGAGAHPPGRRRRGQALPHGYLAAPGGPHGDRGRHRSRGAGPGRLR